jgi:hypothetical protein
MLGRFGAVGCEFKWTDVLSSSSGSIAKSIEQIQTTKSSC